MTQSIIENPILPGFNPDPSIVAVGDDYYIATSTFEWYPGVQIHHSKDLKNWQLVKRPLDRQSLLDMRGCPDSCGIWAPCLSYSNGRFHLIYTDVKRFQGNFKDTHNYYTSCETVDGTWSDPIYMNSSGFDPSLFHDDDGKMWFVNMVWDHRHKHNQFGGILLQEYCPKQQKLVGKVNNIFKGTQLGSTEAPHLYKRNGFYYLLTAEGGTFYAHAMTMARSKTIDGPYKIDPYGYLLTAKDNQHLRLQRAGHGDLVETSSGQTYLVHLCGRPLSGERRCPLGRETAIQKTYWTEDDWLRVDGAIADGLPSYEVPTPSLNECPWPKDPIRYDFDDKALPIAFQWLRTPFPERLMDLHARPGFLRLIGRESIGSLYEHSLVARRQQAFRYRSQISMQFQPNSFQQMAGLVVYYNGHKFHYCYVSIDDQGNRFIDIMSCQGDTHQVLTYPLREGELDVGITDPRFMLPHANTVFIRALVDHHTLNFEFSSDEKSWSRLPANLDQSIVSDEAGGGYGANFTGAFVGMACQDLTGQAISADFDYFEYEEY